MLDNKDTLDRLMNERAVAAVLNVSVATIRRWRLLGQGPKFRKIGASVRYRSGDITAWVESRPTGGDGKRVDCQGAKNGGDASVR
jgi:predicted DNA-binding transcriptional regulator AlpA